MSGVPSDRDKLAEIGWRDCFDFDANGPCGECATCLNGKISALENEVRALREIAELVRRFRYAPGSGVADDVLVARDDFYAVCSALARLDSENTEGDA